MTTPFAVRLVYPGGGTKVVEVAGATIGDVDELHTLAIILAHREGAGVQGELVRLSPYVFPPAVVPGYRKRLVALCNSVAVQETGPSAEVWRDMALLFAGADGSAGPWEGLAGVMERFIAAAEKEQNAPLREVLEGMRAAIFERPAQ